MNLGTCGGFDGLAQVGDRIVAEDTVVYDVVERIGDPTEAIADFSSALPHLWPTRLASKVRFERLLSADQDLDPAAVPELLAGALHPPRPLAKEAVLRRER